MSQPAIVAENIGKRYQIGLRQQANETLREQITTTLTAPLRAARSFFRGNGKFSIPTNEEEFWALKDISFELKEGEVVGVIGRNGAGKSTLLKILSRITEPTTGRIQIRGRISSLLEVGTGFHPELTGRENIYLNGAILGMSRFDIKRKFDEIVAFAEVDKFLDTPVKRYSSGMYVRLAFAVAAYMETDILVVDEVLAVGDADFQKKCFGRMEHLSRETGRTILFVSHSMPAIRTLCSQALVLGNGRILGKGKVDDMIAAYINSSEALMSSTWVRPNLERERAPVFFKTIEASVEGQQPRLWLTVIAQVVCQRKSGPKLFVAVDLCDKSGTPLMQAVPQPEPFMDFQEGEYRIQVDIQLPPLIPDRYLLDLWLGPHYTNDTDYVKNTVAIEIHEDPCMGRSFPRSSNHGHIAPESSCRYHLITASTEPSEMIRGG